VLCEKPLCASLDDAVRMADTRDAAGRLVGIGYQWSYSEGIQALKRDIASGVFGAPACLKTLVLWPRDRRYYTRNSWAGRKATDDGTMVLDSPVNNATAHYLHNMLYVLGPSVTQSVRPTAVTAELYRANNIENYDTAMLRCELDTGAQILFYTTHAAGKLYGPVFEYEFERGTITYERDVLQARMADGSTRPYPSPDEGPYRKITRIVASIDGDGSPECGIEAALSQTVCMLGAQHSSVTPFPADLVKEQRTDDNSRRWVHGLDDHMRRCYDTGRLPSELGLPWAVGAGRMDLGNTWAQAAPAC
jgi:predicted dehydrogenase